MTKFYEFVNQYLMYLPLAVAILMSLIFGFSFHLIIYRLLSNYFKYHQPNILGRFILYMRAPLYLIFPIFFLMIFTSLFDLGAVAHVTSLIFKISIICIMSLFLLKLIDYAEWRLIKAYQILQSGMNRRQQLLTRVHIIRRICYVLIIILTASLILLNFENMREMGRWLIVSAGAAGVITGFAIQKPLANIFSGFQLAFTQPIKIGDKVVLANEFGTVEEITLTHVTICIWDLRRLVLPISYLLENPFQNWSYPTTELIGTVFLYVDYGADVDELREGLENILQSTSLWDKKVGKLQIIELGEHNMQLRILVSARNPDELWDLRCHVREKIITHLRRKLPACIPKLYTHVSFKQE